MNLAAAAKVAVIGLLALALLVPVLMIQGLVSERQARRNEALAGIAEGWGKRQIVSGPYLAIPYERHWTVVRREMVDGKLRETRNDRSESHVLRLPASRVEWTVSADTSEKARGIYKARLYQARLEAQVAIDVPPRARHEDGTSRYKWGTPRLVLGVSDPLGIRAASGTYAFAPGSGDAPIANGLHAPITNLDFSRVQKLDLQISLELGGSETFAIAPPVGTDTAVSMRADWPHPSFQGRFLPARHEITAAGFSAQWKVSRLAARADELIVVALIERVGLYQQLERASKYGFLFIGLTFAAFLLFELLRRLAIHPVQYALVGLALAMFFLLVTALSEHLDFATAYVIATVACVGVITVYLARVLKSARTAVGFGTALGAMYAMLYALLQAEDYALLGGAIVLFTLLAVVMIGTRRVDWYALTTSLGQKA
jgi:inner membrane protein